VGYGVAWWAIICVTFDNVVRPMLINQGANLPLLLIFVGVIGLFIGPVVLAVAYSLLVD
jgi:predicted PurR-regulated permease PerM